MMPPGGLKVGPDTLPGDAAFQRVDFAADGLDALLRDLHGAGGGFELAVEGDFFLTEVGEFALNIIPGFGGEAHGFFDLFRGDLSGGDGLMIDTVGALVGAEFAGEIGRKDLGAAKRKFTLRRGGRIDVAEQIVNPGDVTLHKGALFFAGLFKGVVGFLNAVDDDLLLLDGLGLIGNRDVEVLVDVRETRTDLTERASDATASGAEEAAGCHQERNEDV